jgi:DNA (cytosine-5)-methyltransferase 1
MKLVELFCGCGGFSLGAHNAGFDVAAAYDIDETLTSSYSHNFPEAKLFHRDIAGLSGNEIQSDVDGEIGGIFGGPPCQGFSDIGRRLKDDPRRELLGHFFRIVAEVKPTFFVMENVRGLAYADALPVLEDALGLLDGTYHLLGPQIWDASAFGAATRRNRMFVIGMRRGQADPIDTEAVEAFKRPAATVKAAIADLAGASSLEECDQLPGFDQWRIRRPGSPSAYASALRAPDKKFTGHRPTLHTQAVIERFAKVGQGKFDPIGRHPRLAWNGLCPTLRAGTGADKGSYQSVRPIHPEEDRVITVREAARLQGFPDAHLFHPTVWHSFRMIGNSVSPIMAEAIFSAIAAHLRLVRETAEGDSGPGELVAPIAAAAE